MGGLLYFVMFLASIFIFYLIIEAAVKNGVVAALRDHKNEEEKKQ